MSKKRSSPSSGAILDLWRPPKGAGDAIGCLATTYTFAPALFDEQCLARFLEIESEPDREDLAFLLERESKLSGLYAGVLVDHTQAGVAHSLRWDVLPVRIPGGRQHAKLSVLAWARHFRIIVASANLTEAGYRYNREVAAAVEFGPDNADAELLSEALSFLGGLLRRVPGASGKLPEVERCRGFLAQVQKAAKGWLPAPRARVLRQRLALTQPAAGPGTQARSSLEEAVGACRARGGSPLEAWVASPFFDDDAGAAEVTAALCKRMARRAESRVWFCVPAVRDPDDAGAPRLAAPKALLRTPADDHIDVGIEMLPDCDERENRRPWHAKLLLLSGEGYSAVMIGSSNFTCAGMGITARRNTEANLLTIADRVAHGREARLLQDLWPEMDRVDDPESAEWLGRRPDDLEEEEGATTPLPAGFLAASYRAGEQRRILLRLDPAHLPDDWSVQSCGRDVLPLLRAEAWRRAGRRTEVDLPWQPVQPPETLLVSWAGNSGRLPLNVEEARDLPPPPRLEQMSADDMLAVLAASDPSAALRVWARRQGSDGSFDPDLDSATPIDLDPLRRHDIQATFLHRVRRRARVLAQLRANLQRPVWSRQALEWRLRGLVGVEALADRLVAEAVSDSGPADEALLTLADFLIVLHETDYEPADGALSKGEFDAVYRPFLKELAAGIAGRVDGSRPEQSGALSHFLGRVVGRCRG